MELIVSDIIKSFGENGILRGISFTASEGITRIEGRSGSGKTTLLRIIMGLESADGGIVTLRDGDTVKAAPDNHKASKRSPSDQARHYSVSACFQEDRLLEHLDAEDNLRFAIGKSFSAEQASECLSRLGLELYDPKHVSDYSGGMKRRLSLARALLKTDAEVLILDEPFNGLDEENRGAAAALIEEAAGDKIVLLVSHCSESFSGESVSIG